MLSWKALSLVVAAAVAMNSVTGFEQGNPANVPQIDVTPKDSPVQSQSLVPAWTTATPTASSGGSYSYDSTGSSVAGSSAIDEGSDSKPKGKTDFTLPPSTGSGSAFNPKRPLPSSSGSSTLATGSGLEGSGSAPISEGNLPSLTSSGSNPAGSTGIDEGGDYSPSSTGSDVEGSSATDEGSDSIPKDDGAFTIPPSTGSGSTPGTPTGSQTEGSAGLDEGSSYRPAGKNALTIPPSSGSSSEVAGSSSIDQSSGSAPTDKGDGIPRSGDSSETQGSSSLDESSTSGSAPCDGKFSLAGSSATGSQVAGSSDVNESSASGSASTIKFPGGSTSQEGSASLDEGSSSVPSGKDETPSTSETGSQVAGSSTITQSSDANNPKQFADLIGNKNNGSGGTPASNDQNQTTDSSVAGSSASEPTFPSKNTSCKRRLRQ